MEKPGKLANDLNGYKKKNKLDLPGLSPEAVVEWIEDYRIRKLQDYPGLLVPAKRPENLFKRTVK